MEKLRVIAIAAQTLDGFIARDSEQPANWSSREDKKSFAAATKDSGVVVMGRKTFDTIKKPLPSRLNLVLTSTPNKFVTIPDLLEFVDDSPPEVIQGLKGRGFESVFVIGGAQTYTEFLKYQLLNELWITIEPLVFGEGISIFTEPFYNVQSFLSQVVQLSEETIQLRYRLIYGH